MKAWHLVFKAVLYLCMVGSPGCAARWSEMEVSFGFAYDTVKTSQILDPEATKDLRPVMGLDGEAARRLMEGYRTRFEKPPAPPIFMIPIGQGK